MGPTHDAHAFPVYTPGERLADAIVHGLGVTGAGIGAVWLVTARVCCLPAAELSAVLVYAGALVGMLTISALYHLVRPGRRKELLRRVDHAMIHALIAGTYTPFAVGYIQRGGGDGADLLVVWSVAAMGMTLKLAFPRRFERFGFALYLGLGWAMTVLAPSLWASLPTPTLVLLATGGVLYTLGSMVHLMRSLPYHNAVWHAFVLAAAGCHFVAVVLDTAP